MNTNTECFEVEIDGRVGHIKLNRPEKRNSMIRSFWRDLPRLVQDLDADGSVRAIVVSSTGPHFTSGMDVSVFGGSGEAPTAMDQRRRGAKFYENVLHLQKSFNAFEEARVPVLAAIQGGCIGGGVDLATACDMRYATQDAFFTIFETNIGMTADVGTFPRISKLIPDGVARELAYTGRRMGAEEAMSFGLVNRVFDDQEKLLEGVFEIAHEIARKAPLTIYGCKRMMLHARDHRVADTLDYISIWNASMLQGEEIMEAMQANREKREGEFADLPQRPAHEESSAVQDN